MRQKALRFDPEPALIMLTATTKSVTTQTCFSRLNIIISYEHYVCRPPFLSSASKWTSFLDYFLDGLRSASSGRRPTRLLGVRDKQLVWSCNSYIYVSRSQTFSCALCSPPEPNTRFRYQPINLQLKGRWRIFTEVLSHTMRSFFQNFKRFKRVKKF